jgi:voltage-gated sodium channel
MPRQGFPPCRRNRYMQGDGGGGEARIVMDGASSGAIGGRRRRHWRAWLASFVESPPVQRTIVALILVNAVALGLETWPAAMERIGSLLLVLDRLILAVFVAEIAAKIIGHGWRFFRSAWNLFDFVVVGIALLPAAGAFTVLRALRVLRVLRLVSVMPRMRQVVEGLLRAVPGLGAIVGLLLLVFYVFGVMATKLYGGAFPEWFGTLGRSMYTLFQIMTLESWSMGIVRPVMETFPLAWLFFVPFIVVSSFTVLNLFIAIIVSAMQSEHEEEAAAARQAARDAAHEEAEAVAGQVRALREELREVRRLIERGRPT